jgi:hypothetical protein
LAKVKQYQYPAFEYIADEIRCEFPLLILLICVSINQGNGEGWSAGDPMGKGSTQKTQATQSTQATQ